MEKYRTFVPDKDNILPICDDEYFDDDIVGRFVDFVRLFMVGIPGLSRADPLVAMVRRGSIETTERFLQGPLQAHQKRPIYWLFDSGKKNGFSTIYMHRYSRDLLNCEQIIYMNSRNATARSYT